MHLASRRRAHPRVSFSKRFLQFRDLPKLNLPGWELEVPALFKDTARHPHDVVMVCKQFWASDQLAQAPLLWCPHGWYAWLKQVPWARKDRNVMSNRQVRENKKNSGGGGAETVVHAPRRGLPGEVGGRQPSWHLWGPSGHPIAYRHGLLRTCLGGGHGCRVAGLRDGSPSAHWIGPARK